MKNLLLLSLLLLAPLAHAAAPSSTVPISAMPVTTNVSDSAYFPLIQPYPGRTTNDNFRATTASIFLGRSNAVFTNVTVISNITVNQTIVLAGTNVASVNPTLGRIPYKATTNTFGDSALFFIDTNTVGTVEIDTSTLGVTNLVTGGVVQSVDSGMGFGYLTNVANGSGALTNDGAGNLGWSVISSGTTINPTDGYLPYRSSSTTFGDSPWYRISSSQLGLGSTNFFLLSSGQNLSLGQNSLANKVTTSSSTAIGFQALNADTTGTRNTAVGASAMQNSIGAFDNVAIGVDSLLSSVTGPNVAVGNFTLQSVTSGQNNIAIGDSALNKGTSIGDNVAVGELAGEEVQSLYGVYVGSEAGRYASHIFGTSFGNTFVGRQSGLTNAYGKNTVAVGHSSGSDSTNANTSVFVGSFSGIGSSKSITNAIAIGAYSTVTNNNEIVIGNSTNTKAIFPITSYTGAGNLVLTDDGTYKSVSSAGGLTINATDTYLPARLNATTFTNSPAYTVGATNLALDGQFYLGPGTTSVIQHASSLIFTNSATGASDGGFEAINGNGQRALFTSSGNLAIVRGEGGVSIYDSITAGNELRWFGNRLWNIQANTILGGDFNSNPHFPFGIVNQNTNRVVGYFDTTATNTSYGVLYHGGTNDFFHISSIGGGIAGTAKPLLVTIGGTNVFQCDTNSAASTTGLLIYENGTAQRVSIGANDSGGAGFRVLRIPN